MIKRLGAVVSIRMMHKRRGRKWNWMDIFPFLFVVSSLGKREETHNSSSCVVALNKCGVSYFIGGDTLTGFLRSGQKFVPRFTWNAFLKGFSSSWKRGKKNWNDYTISALISECWDVLDGNSNFISGLTDWNREQVGGGHIESTDKWEVVAVTTDVAELSNNHVSFWIINQIFENVMNRRRKKVFKRKCESKYIWWWIGNPVWTQTRFLLYVMIINTHVFLSRPSSVWWLIVNAWRVAGQ